MPPWGESGAWDCFLFSEPLSQEQESRKQQPVTEGRSGAEDGQRPLTGGGCRLSLRKKEAQRTGNRVSPVFGERSTLERAEGA